MVVSVSWIRGMDTSKVLSESLCSGLALKHEGNRNEDKSDLCSEQSSTLKYSSDSPFCLNQEM